MPRDTHSDPPFLWRIGQIIYVPSHSQHGEVIERERTNDGESQICPRSIRCSSTTRRSSTG